MRNTGLALTLALLAAVSAARPAAAQEEAQWGLDTAVAVNRFVGTGAGDRPDVVVDFTVTTRLGSGWTAYVRPWFRSASSRPYPVAKEIYQAVLQHESRGRIATRTELGYILSPIGIGMMDMRPDTNPTISPHMAYLIPMPSFETGVPASLPIASSYPLGGQFTASTTTWDARAAVVTSPPNRMYVVGLATPNPKPRPVTIVGGGVTPRTGLRFGAGYATGVYATSEEVVGLPSSDRHSQLMTVEGDFAFGYSRVTGEVAHNWLESRLGTRTAMSWFLQGQHTLSPRWFVAARLEGANAPARTPGAAGPTLRMSEYTAGYRLTPAFTLRGSVARRKTYFNTVPSNQAGVSVVWAQRWR